MRLQYIKANLKWFLGVFIALLSAWYFWANTFAPNVTFDLQKFATIFRSAHHIDELVVTYEERILDHAADSISVATFSVGNDGDDVGFDDYDPLVGYGLVVSNSVILSASIISTNSEYLEQRAEVNIDDNRVTLEPIIWAKGDELLLELILLHEVGSRPDISAFGRLLRQGDIPYSESYFEQPRRVDRVIDFVVAAAPWFLGFLALLLLESLRQTFIDTRDRKHTVRLLNAFRDSRDNELSERARSFLDHLENISWEDFYKTFEALEEDEDEVTIKQFAKSELALTRLRKINFSRRVQRVLSGLIREKYFDLEKLDFEGDVKPTLAELRLFLRNRGYFGPS